MPDWKDRLRPASFSGIPFGVRESELSGGRRAVVHEYPLRDRPFVEELGRDARSISVDGYLVGDDYAERRDRLRDAMEQASPGFPTRPGRLLVHPTFGSLLSLCRSFRFRESTDEGRMVRFQAEFVEVGEELEPNAAVDGPAAADQAGTALGAGASAAFAGGVETAGVVEQAREAVSSVVRSMSVTLRRLDVFSGALRSVEQLESELSSLLVDLSELVTAPADLAARVLGTLDTVMDAAGTASGALEAYRALFDFPPLEGLGDDAQGLQAAENGRLTAELIRTGAVAGAVRAAARVSWETLADAQEARDELGAELDALEELAADDVVPLLERLRSVLATSVPPADQDLPSLRSLTLPATTPALVVAHSLYQDPFRDAEVVRRNAVRHPSRVPGGVPLLVLSR
jgi:prophage DNA circulation protein